LTSKQYIEDPDPVGSGTFGLVQSGFATGHFHARNWTVLCLHVV